MSALRKCFCAILVTLVCLGMASCKGDSKPPKKNKIKPEVYLLIPAKGSVLGGTQITIFTRNFQDNFLADTPQVTFGGNLATNFVPATPAEFYVTLPPGASPGAVDVTVTSTGVIETATCDNCFSYEPPPTCTVNGVDPGYGDVAGGDTVTVFGSGFGSSQAHDPVPDVYFGTEVCPIVLRLSDAELEVEVPPAVGGMPGRVTVEVRTGTGAQCSILDGYEYTVVECTLDSIVPDSGSTDGNETVLINGSDFDPLATVLFGAVPASNVSVSPTGNQIICVTPVGMAEGLVTVTVNNVTHSCFKVDGFRFLPPGGCEVLSVRPGGGPATGGYMVTIAGSGFEETPVPEVRFGANVASTVTWQDDKTLIDVQVPASGVLGLFDVTVTNRSTGRSCTLVDGFEYLQGGHCGLYEVSPGQGETYGGNSVTIFGAQLSPNPVQILFGPEQVDLATGFNWVDAETVQVTVPIAFSEGTVDVTYVNPGPNACVLVDGYEYRNPPQGCTITSIEPTAGLRTGGTWVTIRGQDFAEEADGGVRVFFGKPPGNWVMANPYFTVVKDGGEEVTTVTPGILNPKTVDVLIIATGLNSTCTLQDAFTYLEGCTIHAVTPSTGSVVGGSVVNIFGDIFDPSGYVRFGQNFSPDVTVLGPAQITAVTPPSDVEGPVDVVVLGNMATQCRLEGGFTYTGGSGGGGCEVTGVVPAQGTFRGGEQVTVTGSGFDPGPPVPGILFGFSPASGVIHNSQFSLSCTTPPALYPGEVDVTVVNANGDVCVKAGAYLYDPQPICDTPCTITDVMPVQGPLSGGGPVQLGGTGFCPGAKVYIGENRATVNLFDTDKIVVQAPQGSAPGPTFVLVIQRNGQICSLVDSYTYY